MSVIVTLLPWQRNFQSLFLFELFSNRPSDSTVVHLDTPLVCQVQRILSDVHHLALRCCPFDADMRKNSGKSLMLTF